METKQENEYIMGVIGGMGSKSTSYFLDEVFEKTEAHRDQDHINLICLNHATIPDRTDAINSTKNDPESQMKKTLISKIKQDLEILKNLNVQFVAIPCNTVFYFMKEILQDESFHSLPIVSILDETVKFVHSYYGDEITADKKYKIGVLATTGTVASDIYKTAFTSNTNANIEIVYPNKEDQDRVTDIIYRQVKESGYEGDMEGIYTLVAKMKSQYGCNVVILGCTELSYARKNKFLPDHCVDALDCLVRSSITLAGKQIKKEII